MHTYHIMWIESQCYRLYVSFQMNTQYIRWIYFFNSFGNPDWDELSILAPLYQCCRYVHDCMTVCSCVSIDQSMCASFSYPESFSRAVNGAQRGALAKSITGYHKNMARKQYPVLELANQMPVRIWIWPEPLVAPRVRRALGRRMCMHWR